VGCLAVVGLTLLLVYWPLGLGTLFVALVLAVAFRK
jgi:hypothetical protein